MTLLRSTHELEDYRARGFANHMGFGKHPALVVVDLTNGFTNPSLPLGAPADEAIEQVNLLIDAARVASIPIYFSTISYDGPEFSDAGVWLLKIRGLASLRANTSAVEVDSRIKRAPDDSVIAKRYASCFFGTDLNSRLRWQGVDTVVVTGCSTSGCVRATAVDACQNGFRTIVAREAVTDRSEAAHRQSLIDIEAKYGDVLSVSDVVANFLNPTLSKASSL